LLRCPGRARAAAGTVGVSPCESPGYVILLNWAAPPLLVQVVLNPTTYPLNAFESAYAAMRAEFKGCVVATTINTHRDSGGH
jgi:hypothetical protein